MTAAGPTRLQELTAQEAAAASERGEAQRLKSEVLAPILHAWAAAAGWAGVAPVRRAFKAGKLGIAVTWPRRSLIGMIVSLAELPIEGFGALVPPASELLPQLPAGWSWDGGVHGDAEGEGEEEEEAAAAAAAARASSAISDAQLKRAYFSLARVLHPDKTAGTQSLLVRVAAEEAFSLLTHVWTAVGEAKDFVSGAPSSVA